MNINIFVCASGVKSRNLQNYLTFTVLFSDIWRTRPSAFHRSPPKDKRSYLSSQKHDYVTLDLVILKTKLIGILLWSNIIITLQEN